MTMNTQTTGMFKCPECGMLIHYMGANRHYKEYHPKQTQVSVKEPKVVKKVAKLIKELV